MSSIKKVAKRATKKSTTSRVSSNKKISSQESGRKSSSQSRTHGKKSVPAKEKASASTVRVSKSSTRKPAASDKVANKPTTIKRAVKNVSETSKKTVSKVVAKAVVRPKTDGTKLKSSKKNARELSKSRLPKGDSAEDILLITDPGFLDSSEVHDETDHAQHQQLREQAAIQERARQMARPETHPDFDGEHCVECDDVMPEYRLKIGRVRCVDCQQIIEDRQKRSSSPGSSASSYSPDDW